MRIISKFQDYYDSALAYGQDLTVVYSRAEKEYDKVPEEFKFFEEDTTGSEKYWRIKTTWSSNHFNLFIIKVAFCGLVHHGIKVVQFKPVKDIDPPVNPLIPFNEIVRCFYNYDELANFMNKYNQPWFFEDTKYSWETPTGKAIRTHLDVPPDKRFYDLFVQKRIPIMIYENVDRYAVSRHLRPTTKLFSLKENTKLADYQFYKVFDAFTTYQELDMFISGVLAPENKPMTAIDDKHKAYQHGFDCYSFKKGPSKKEPKCCKKP